MSRPEPRGSSEYTFTFAALTEKWAALGVHAAVALVITATLLAMRGRDG